MNIDHVATLRQARRETFPDVVEAAGEVVKGGADGIVFHLREDRRHIQDADVRAIKEKVGSRLDFEMAATEEIAKIALEIAPDMITLVPEKRQEITTEGGLDVVSHSDRIKKFIEPFRRKNIKVSLFIDPVREQIEASAKTGAGFIEIHTGAYALSADKLNDVVRAAELAGRLGLRVNAGHGLDYNNVRNIAAIKEIEELNIGFSIIARSVFVGLRAAVEEMRAAMDA